MTLLRFITCSLLSPYKKQQLYSSVVVGGMRFVIIMSHCIPGCTTFDWKAAKNFGERAFIQKCHLLSTTHPGIFRGKIARAQTGNQLSIDKDGVVARVKTLLKVV